MEPMLRHQRVWRLLYKPAALWFCRKFNFEPELCKVEGPCLVISNHVTPLDPVLVALSFPHKPLYYVASEHIFRRGLVSKVLEWLLSPISRRKGDSGADTVMNIMRRVRKGASVGLFAEGDCSWDGYTGHVFPATGKLARSCGATLVTYRLEGGYLSMPRWGKGIRRGKMRGHMVGAYPPEQLKAMKPDEIYELICRDIYENAWERQEREQVRFACKAPARGVESLLYICPACGAVGRLRGEKAHIRCACGAAWALSSDCRFAREEPFPDLGEWDAWQRKALETLKPDEKGVLFSDGDMELVEILPGHKTRSLGVGTLIQRETELECCGEHFAMSGLEGMAIYTAQTLVFSHDRRYFEIRSKRLRCARKYLDYHSLFVQRAAEARNADAL